MKVEWQTKKLGEICTVDWGNTDLTKSAYVEDGKYLAVSAAGCDGRIGHREHTRHTPVLSAIGAQCGRMFLPGEDFTAIKNTITLTPRKTECTGKFLYQLLTYIQLPKRGAAQPFISKGDIQAFEVPLPPISEQQRIVSILDEAFEAIAAAKATAEKNLQNARALFESHLQSVFTQRGKGWKETTLSQATEGIFTGPFGSLLHKSDYVTDGIPLVNPAHITEVGIEPDMRKTVSKETATRLKNYIMREGDIVIGRRGEMGRCALVTAVEDGWLCGTGSFFMRPSNRCDTRYLVRFLRSEACKARLEKIAGGAVMPNLSNTDLGNLLFNLPPLERQKSIIDEVDTLHEETQRLTAIYERKIAALDELKKSLLDQAFTGALTKDLKETSAIFIQTSPQDFSVLILHAGILAIAYKAHVVKGSERHFGHVKAEKVAHMAEAWAGIELGRRPIKDAAGPNDFPHLMEVEACAKEHGYFLFPRTEGGGYKLIPLENFDSLIEKTRATLGGLNAKLDKLIELTLPMKKTEVEVFATVYAAWNNLLLDGVAITEKRIVRAAREDWHPDKLDIPREHFIDAIQSIKEKGLVPTGEGKKVGEKITKKGK